MRTWRESIACIGGITVLVCGATWFAKVHETGNRPVSLLPGAGESQDLASPVAVRRFDWSADGLTIVSHSQGGFGPGESLALHDAMGRSGAMPIDIGGEPVGDMALSPDGHRLAIGTYSGKLWWYDLDSLNPILLFDDSRRAVYTSMAISADGRFIAAAAGAGRIHLCNPSRGTLSTLSGRRQSSVASLCFSRNGRWLLGAHMDGSICHWQLETGTLLREIAGNGLPATAVAFLPGDQRIISAGLDGGVRICDLRSGREEWRGEFGKLGISALALAPDGKIAAWGGYDHRIVIWDVELKEKRFEITIPATVVSQLKFSRDGTTLAIAGRERTIRLYDTQTWSEKEGIPVGPPLH